MATVSNTTGALVVPAHTLTMRTSLYALNANPQNDVVQMIDVYPGDQVMDVIVDYDNLGANTAITVGDGGSANRFVTSTATTSAGKASFNAAAANRAYAYTVQDTIDVTVSGSGAATGNIRVTAYIKRTGSTG
jgi:hypothetical protein